MTAHTIFCVLRLMCGNLLHDNLASQNFHHQTQTRKSKPNFLPPLHKEKNKTSMSSNCAYCLWWHTTDSTEYGPNKQVYIKYSCLSISGFSDSLDQGSLGEVAYRHKIITSSKRVFTY